MGCNCHNEGLILQLRNQYGLLRQGLCALVIEAVKASEQAMKSNLTESYFRQSSGSEWLRSGVSITLPKIYQTEIINNVWRLRQHPAFMAREQWRIWHRPISVPLSYLQDKKMQRVWILWDAVFQSGSMFSPAWVVWTSTQNLKSCNSIDWSHKPQTSTNNKHDHWETWSKQWWTWRNMNATLIPACRWSWTRTTGRQRKSLSLMASNIALQTQRIPTKASNWLRIWRPIYTKNSLLQTWWSLQL